MELHLQSFWDKVGNASTSGGVGEDNLAVIKCSSVEDDSILLNMVYLERN